LRLTIKRDYRHAQKRDSAVLKRHVHKQLERLWKRCVQEFIKEASLHIAIDTGMSMASMMPLAAKVQLASFLRSRITGSSGGPRRGYTDMNFNYNPSQQKSIAHGQRLGARAYDLTFGSTLNPKLTFEFNIVVLQHYLHESSSNYKRSHHWQSLERGREAFLAAWNILHDEYVNPQDINRWILTGVWRAKQ